MKNYPVIIGLGALSLLSLTSYAADFGGPDTVENTLPVQQKKEKNWREEIAEKGVSVGADYTALGITSPNGSEGNQVNRASGVARVYGTWGIVNKGGKDTGSLVWKAEHRHAYSKTPPKNAGFIDDVSGGPEGLGYVGMIGAAYNDQAVRVTNLHWKQKLNNGKTTVIGGWQDVTDYVDTYALASPWTGFTNLAFSTGAGAMGLPDDGILAISAGHMITDNLYAVAGIADANGKSDDILDGFNTVFDESQFLPR